ncbi:hypothetical protein PFISCL1PPCAC_22149, partial [Pristionchus fissidentatus]
SGLKPVHKMPGRIDQITTFDGPEVDGGKRLLLAVRTRQTVSVLTLQLGRDLVVTSVAELTMDEQTAAAHSTSRFFAFGTLDRYEVWLVGRPGAIMWKAPANTQTPKCLAGLTGDATATTAARIYAQRMKKVTADAHFLNLFCVGTAEGRVRCFHSLNTSEGWLELDSVDGAIIGIDCEVYKYLYALQNTSHLTFCVRLFILLECRVVVRDVRFLTTEAKPTRLGAATIGECNLDHTVTNPTLFALEKCTGIVDLKRLVVVDTAGNYEVLLFNEKKLDPDKGPLEIVVSEKKDKYTLRNNTNRVMHVGIKSSTVQQLLGAKARRLEPRSETPFKVTLEESARSTVRDNEEEVVLEWRLEKSGRRKKKEGEQKVRVMNGPT